MKRDEAMKLATDGFQALSDSLAQGKSESLVTYLSAMAQFHNYSFRNSLLIFKQRETATRVAGFRQWQKLGRTVKKGEKGIGILAPLVYKQSKDDQPKKAAKAATDVKSSEKEIRGFRIVHVFDVAQTEGESLPEFTGIEGEPGQWLLWLKNIVSRAGIEVQYEDDLDGAEGLSRGGRISILSSLPPAESFYVLAHEYAHERLHKGTRRKETTQKVRETEADAVAFVVSKAIGLDCQNHASDYIQLYHGDVDTLQESMHFIQKTAADMIAALQEKAKQSEAMEDAMGEVFDRHEAQYKV